jgi:hypothetical protein
MKKRRTKKLMKQWSKQKAVYEDADMAAMDAQEVAEVWHDDFETPEGLAELARLEEREKQLKAISHAEWEKLRRIERRMHPDFVEYLKELWRARKEAEWEKDLEQKKAQGLAYSDGHSLHIWFSLEARLEWEVENPEKAAAMHASGQIPALKPGEA